MIRAPNPGLCCKYSTEAKNRPLPYRYPTTASFYGDYTSKVLPQYAAYQTCDRRFKFLVPFETESRLASVPMPTHVTRYAAARVHVRPSRGLR